MDYPIEIEIDDPHAEVIDELLTEVESCLEAVRDRWSKTEDRIVHTADLDDLLTDQHVIAIIWDIQHVKDQRPDLSDEQAWEVLQECQQSHERLNDPMLGTIRQVADNLYPPQRQARHVKAAEIIAGYGNGDERDNLVNLLTDTMHFCQDLGVPFAKFCDTAKLHFTAETNPSTKGIKP